MNERIKHLAEQATQEFSLAFESDKWQEKLAELIVKECVDKTFDSEKGIGPTRWKNEVMAELKEHFGVKE